MFKISRILYFMVIAAIAFWLLSPLKSISVPINELVLGLWDCCFFIRNLIDSNYYTNFSSAKTTATRLLGRFIGAYINALVPIIIFICLYKIKIIRWIIVSLTLANVYVFAYYFYNNWDYGAFSKHCFFVNYLMGREIATRSDIYNIPMATCAIISNILLLMLFLIAFVCFAYRGWKTTSIEKKEPIDYQI